MLLSVCLSVCLSVVSVLQRSIACQAPFSQNLFATGALFAPPAFDIKIHIKLYRKRLQKATPIPKGLQFISKICKVRPFGNSRPAVL